MKKIVFILSLISISNLLANEDMFNMANLSYTNQNYEEAILMYKDILSQGNENYKVYYNLGNCYYKNKDWANAIWHYEKSLKIHQNTKTIENLGLTKRKIVDKIEPLPELFYKRWWKNLYQLFKIQTWQILAIISIWICLILNILNYFINTQLYHKTIPYLLLISFLFASISYSSFKNNIDKKEGIIFTSSLVVYSAPTDNSTDLFSLHAGTKIEIVDEIGEWVNIKTINGNRGWIKEGNFKTL